MVRVGIDAWYPLNEQLRWVAPTLGKSIQGSQSCAKTVIETLLNTSQVATISQVLALLFDATQSIATHQEIVTGAWNTYISK